MRCGLSCRSPRGVGFRAEANTPVPDAESVLRVVKDMGRLCRPCSSLAVNLDQRGKSMLDAELVVSVLKLPKREKRG